MKKILALILVSVFLLLCLSGCRVSDSSNDEDAKKHQTLLPEEMPEDFSFIVRWDSGGCFKYDSSNGQLIKHSFREDGSTTYVMPKEELETIYKLIYDLNIESYPDMLDESTYQLSDPSQDFYLTVNANGVCKTVAAISAEGLNYGKTPEAKKFFNTVKYIINLLQNTEEWKSLPTLPSGPIY